MRQMELETQRAAEQVAMLEVSLASAREFAEKAAVSARWKLGAANERARRRFLLWFALRPHCSTYLRSMSVAGQEG